MSSQMRQLAGSQSPPPSPWAWCEGVLGATQEEEPVGKREGKVESGEPPAWSGRGLRHAGLDSLGQPLGG